MDLIWAYSNHGPLRDEIAALLAMVPDRPAGQAGSGRGVRRARRLRSGEVDELVVAYERGATVYELARRFGIHRVTVGKHLRARGIDTTPPGLAPDDITDAVKLYEGGWSLARIARRYGTTDHTVRARLIEAGVRMRDTHGRRR